MDSTSGTPTWPEIISALRASEVFVVICSHRSIGRDGLMKELKAALDKWKATGVNASVVPWSMDEEWLSRSRRRKNTTDLVYELGKLNRIKVHLLGEEAALERLFSALRR